MSSVSQSVAVSTRHPQEGLKLVILRGDESGKVGLGITVPVAAYLVSACAAKIKCELGVV